MNFKKKEYVAVLIAKLNKSLKQSGAFDKNIKIDFYSFARMNIHKKNDTNCTLNIFIKHNEKGAYTVKLPPEVVMFSSKNNFCYYNNYNEVHEYVKKEVFDIIMNDKFVRVDWWYNGR